MGEYDVMQVCLDGHRITSSYNRNSELGQDFCDKCGKKTITSCPKCKTPIRGYYRVDGVLDLSEVPVPKHCHSCGEPYPWMIGRPEVEETVQKVEYDPLSLVEQICSGFHLVARQLAERHNNRPTLTISDEYDVQDLLHALLKLHFDDIRTEEWTPSYAGRSSRMDFLLKNEAIVIETKKTRTGLGIKEIGDELLIDIQRYQNHADCKLLFCFVYDPGEIILNPRELEKDLSKESEKLGVKVLVVPKGY